MAMLLVTSGLLTMSHTMITGIKANYRTRQEAQAMAYAQQKTEALQALAFTHADLTAGTHADTPAAGFARTWTVTDSGSEKTIRVTLIRSIPGQTAPVRVVLIIARAQ